MNSDIIPGSVDVRQQPAVVQAPALSSSLEQNMALDQQISQHDIEGPVEDYEPPKRRRFSWRRIGGFAAIIVGIALGALLLYHNAASSHQAALQAQLNSGVARVRQQTLPLPDLSQELLSKAQAESSDSLTVNGQIKVNSSLVLQPSAQPSNPVAGELYYDLSHSQMNYYNGKEFVPVTPGGNTTINNVTNNGATTKVTNVTNVNGGGGTLSGVGGTAGSIAMFTDSATLGDSLLTQNGNNLDTGNLVETVTLGSTNGASATTLQGGLSGLSLLTGNQNGTTGGIVIQSGDSATTAAGNVSIDTGNSIINGTVVGNKDFENGVDNMGDGIFGDNSVVTQSNAQAHGGTHSLAISVGSNFFPEWAVQDGAGNPPMIIPVAAGHTYAFSAWVRAGTTSSTITAGVTWSNDGFYGGGQISQQNFGTVTDIPTGWRHVTGVLTAPAGAVVMGFYFISFDATTPGEVHYFDDITATDLSSSSSTAAIDIGATNAQLITIGNSGMLAPTSIYGGGVNIAAGSGIMNLSATTLTASAGGASLTTTTGALDLTAATDSTWKIGNSGGGGGNLNIQAGNAGGNGNGGNLVLQSGAASGLGTGGSVIVLPQTDSTDAFQIQNSGGTPLLTADTTDMVLTVQALAVTGTLTVNGHIVSGGGTPGIAAGVAACTAPTVSVSGTDTSGTITVTTGTGCAASGTLGTITFANPFGAAPHVSLTPGGSNALALGAYVDDSTISGNSFDIGTNTTPSSSSTYKWNYLVVQ